MLTTTNIYTCDACGTVAPAATCRGQVAFPEGWANLDLTKRVNGVTLHSIQQHFCDTCINSLRRANGSGEKATIDSKGNQPITAEPAAVAAK